MNFNKIIYLIIISLFSLQFIGNTAVEELIVEGTRVKRGEIKDEYKIIGDILPYKQVTVFSELPGIVKKIFVNEGDYVNKGQLIALLDCKEYELQFKSAKAALEVAQIKFNNAKTEFERAKKLYKQDAISRQKYDMSKYAFEAAKAGIKQAQSSFQALEEKISKCKIKAPISGIIAKKFQDEGEMIVATSMMKTSPLVTIIQIDKVKVKTSLPSIYYSKTNKNIEITITNDVYPDKIWKAKISKISPIIDPLSRSFDIEMVIENENFLLKPGMFANVNIIFEHKKDALLVPRESVIIEGNKSYVFTVENGISKKINVKTGIITYKKVEIISGLKEGQLVVTFGARRLKEGMKVKVIEKEYEL